MGVFEIIGSILLILSCIVLVAVISMQQSAKSGGLNALGAMHDDNTVAGRNKAKTMDAMMLKVTKIVAVAMFVLTFVVYAIGAFTK